MSDKNLGQRIDITFCVKIGKGVGISKRTAATSAQVSEYCFHRAIPGIKSSHHVSMYVYTVP